MLRILQGPSPALYISQADMDTQKQMRGSVGKTSQFVSFPVKWIFFHLPDVRMFNHCVCLLI